MNSLQTQVATELLRTAYRQLPTVISSVAGAGLLVFLLKDIHSYNLLTSWLAVAVTDGIVAVLLYVYFIKFGQEDLSHPRWQMFFVVFAACTGLVWGAIGIIFYSAPVEYKLLIIVWLWTLGAGMTSLLVAHKPAFYTMLVLLLAPLFIRMAMDPEAFYRGLAVATFIWMLSLMYFHYGNHKTLYEAVHLRFVNDKLVADLDRKNKEAENANLAKSRFLAAASHDLRQPLHAQGLFLTELDQYVDSPIARRILGGLESSVYAMRKLLNAILDISKLDAGTITPEVRTFNVSTLFNNLQSEFEVLAAEKNIKLRIQRCNLIVQTDPVLLENILRNLIANAIRYTQQGKVLLGCRWHGETVDIQVLDTGIGIPENKQDEIFMPFMQLGNPERDREKGLGLGLSIVQRTAELLNHPLSIKSETEKGTVISITVPLSDQPALLAPKVQPVNNVADVRGKCVLVIDDDHDVCTAMHGLLESWQCLPVVFQNVSEALRYIEQNNEAIDVVLSDFRLSRDANGIQAIEEIRAQYGSSIPAALITGDTSVNRLREAKHSGFRLLHKPVLAGELRTLISKLTAQS